MMLQSSAPRQGLTLLEVLFATVIFLLSVVALTELVSMGSERAQIVKLQARTSMRCQGKLAEIMAGVQTLSGGSDYTNFQEANDLDKDLQWKMDVSEGNPASNLYTVKVWVKGELPGGRVVESYLVRIMLDPSIRGSTMDQPNTPPTPATNGM